jgi:hypothetical protein
VYLVELERIELSPSRLKVGRLTIRLQFLRIMWCARLESNHYLRSKNPLLILMSFERESGAG